MSTTLVNIDSIVLTDLDLAPERAERIKQLLQQELQRMLEQEGSPGGMIGSEVSNLSGLVISLDRIDSDFKIATRLSESICQVLRSAGQIGTERD